MTDGKGYRRQNKATHIERKCQKSPRNYTAGNGFGRSFLMSVAERNTTSFVGNAKGAASRAFIYSNGLDQSSKAVGRLNYKTMKRGSGYGKRPV